eukprot:TRINITY_DN1533_c0_g1_i2.p1 TRINITY_DN1533_c0_g1~~TRINITY_DN1533_c0_g1_i2.p1  ORF type:complete len:264 (-),score=109.53 TRINITY_DN1533_c0_g1_i2:102-893(-)
MFEARFSTAALLKKITASLSDLLTEICIDVAPAGISIQSMDSSMIALVSLLLRADGFEHYRCDHNASLGLNLANLNKILKCASNDDVLTLKTDDAAEANSLTITFENDQKTRTSEFELKLIDIENEKLGIPDQQYQSKVTCSATRTQNIFRDLAVLGETVKITTSKEGVKFSVQGDVSNGHILLKQHEEAEEGKANENVLIEMHEALSLDFALRYLNYFAKASSLSANCTLALSKDVPLVCEYTIEDFGYIRFYLAPKIDEDE